MEVQKHPHPYREPNQSMKPISVEGSSFVNNLVLKDRPLQTT